jgi:hypothetical protein
VVVAAACAGAAAALPFQAFYEEVQAEAMSYAYEAGDWQQDFGDAAYYGPAFMVGAGLRYGRADFLARGEEALARNTALIARVKDEPGLLLEQADELLMAALGVVETLASKGSAGGQAELDAFLDVLDPLVDGFGDYLDLGQASYAMQTYGATTVTSVVALLNLRYAELLKPARAAERTAFGLKVIDAIDAKAWTGTVYRIGPGNEMLELYPNVSMILANATAFRLTGEERYRERCKAVHQGMQALKDPVKKNYRSPYSAATMGAKTEDYSTLSSQNYAMMALAMLWEITGEPRHRDEIVDIAAFIHDYLWHDGKILHHWMDGRVAVPTDPEYFCTGCQLQFLFVSLYLERYVFDNP